MVKIQFQLKDENNNRVSQAKLVLYCSLINGESWQSDTLISDESGVSSLVVEANLLRRFDWSTAKPRLTRSGRQIAVLETKKQRKQRGQKQRSQNKGVRLN